MPDLETQISAYADELEQLVPEIPIPGQVRSRRKRSARAVGAAAAVVAASLMAAVALLPGDDDQSDVAAEGTTGQSEGPEPADLPDGCLVAEDLERPPGLGGAPVTDVLPGGVDQSFDIGPLVARTITGQELDGEWFAVSAPVTDQDGLTLGVAVWVMPDSIVAIAGGVRHLYAANELAVTVSDWKAPPVTIEPSQVDAATACVP